MKLITVSREYGAGGGEVASPARDSILGWELLDHELLHRAAQLEHLPDSELEALDEQAISLADRFRLHPPHERYIHGLSEAARQAVAQGNVILVGRGLAPTGRRDPRGVPSAAGRPEGLESPADGGDRGFAAWSRPRPAVFKWTGPANDSRSTSSARTASRPCQYDLVVNTGRVPLDEVVALVAALVSQRLDLARGPRDDRPRGS